MSARAAADSALNGLIVSEGRPDFRSRVAEGLDVVATGERERADFVICDMEQADFETARREALAIGKPLCLVIPGPLPFHSKTTPSSFSYVMLKSTILSRYGNAAEAAIRALLADALQAGRAPDTSMIGHWRSLPPADGNSPRRQEANPETRALQILLEAGQFPDDEEDGFWRVLADACAGSRIELDRVIGPLLQKNTAWFEPYHQSVIDGPGALESLRLIETRWAENDRPVHCFGIEEPGRPFVSAVFAGKGGPVSFHESEAETLAAAGRDSGIVLAAQRRTAEGLDQSCRDSQAGLLYLDDGFSSLTGLDRFLPAAALLAADDLAAPIDASQPSRLETLLQTYELNDEEMSRGQALLSRLARLHVPRDEADRGRTFAVPKGRKTVLVPGERRGCVGTASDTSDIELEFLRHVRERDPDAFIVFKPLAGREAGRASTREVRRLADLVETKADMADLIGQCDRMETYSSPSGLVALLQGMPVTVHGQPFYTGWGMTEDLSACARRTTRRTLSELVYLTLVIYARSTDPVSMVPCPPELLIDRAVARQREIRQPERPSRRNPISWLGRKLGL